ncbi:MAG: redoxin family protein [Saprospiraceae bacterium]|nr:redoxin family protein [Saprospiraceae bacterium]
MKFILTLFFLLSLAIGTNAQAGCEILVRLEQYTYDTLWFGTTYGKRVVPDFFALKQADGSFLLKTEKPLAQGMYAILYKRAANAALQSFQVWLVDGERKFSLTTNYTAPYESPMLIGSPENDQLYRYLRQFNLADAALDEAIARWRYIQDEATWWQRVKAEEDFRKFQDDFIAGAKLGLTTHLVGQILLPLPPASAKPFTDWKQEAEARWAYQQAHYFDKMSLATPDFLSHPQWLDRADFFWLGLPPPVPDSTRAAIELVFKKLEPFADGYNYYQKYVINSLAKMSQFQLDEVYVYFVRNYLSTGKATWAEPNEVKTAVSNANTLERLFEGKQAPPATVMDRNNNPISLKGIKSKLTMLIFYMPDCGHCKLELPIVAKLYEKYKDKGLQVVPICLKHGEDTQQCWDYLDTQTFPKEWLFLADPERKANLVPVYGVKGYPRLIMLDENWNIRWKRNGESAEWQLDAMLERFLK